MKVPKEKQITVWDCGFGHNHRTLSAAEECIAKQNPSPFRKSRKKIIERNREAVLMRVEGITYKAVGEHFGLGAGAFCAIYKRELRRLQHPYRFRELPLSDRETAIVRGDIEDPVTLRNLFVRMWVIVDENNT